MTYTSPVAPGQANGEGAQAQSGSQVPSGSPAVADNAQLTQAVWELLSNQQQLHAALTSQQTNANQVPATSPVVGPPTASPVPTPEQREWENFKVWQSMQVLGNSGNDSGASCIGTTGTTTTTIRVEPDMVAVPREELLLLQKKASIKKREIRNFPPEPSSTGKRYYAAKDEQVATEYGGVYCGHTVMSAAFLNGRTWDNTPKGNVIGFERLEDATACYFGWYSKRNTLSIRK